MLCSNEKPTKKKKWRKKLERKYFYIHWMKTIVQKKIIKTLYSSELELQIEKCRENEKKKKIYERSKTYTDKQSEKLKETKLGKNQRIYMNLNWRTNQSHAKPT